MGMMFYEAIIGPRDNNCTVDWDNIYRGKTLEELEGFVEECGLDTAAVCLEFPDEMSGEEFASCCKNYDSIEELLTDRIIVGKRLTVIKAIPISALKVPPFFTIYMEDLISASDDGCERYLCGEESSLAEIYDLGYNDGRESCSKKSKKSKKGKKDQKCTKLYFTALCGMFKIAAPVSGFEERYYGIIFKVPNDKVWTNLILRIFADDERGNRFLEELISREPTVFPYRCAVLDSSFYSSKKAFKSDKAVEAVLRFNKEDIAKLLADAFAELMDEEELEELEACDAMGCGEFENLKEDAEADESSDANDTPCNDAPADKADKAVYSEEDLAKAIEDIVLPESNDESGEDDSSDAE